MEKIDKKAHWETVYETKKLTDVSWYQRFPEISLILIESCTTDKSKAIIDIGGGDSLLADHLLERAYNNLTVLDISSKALERARIRLGDKASGINWVESDIIDFTSDKKFEIWHDRAVFHFLTEDSDIKKYLQTAADLIAPDGYLIIGTFSLSGPVKCSGLEIKQYSAESLEEVFAQYFELLEVKEHAHITPSGNTQNFIFCRFKKKPNDL